MFSPISAVKSCPDLLKAVHASTSATIEIITAITAVVD